MAHRGQQTAGGTGGHSKDISPLMSILGAMIGGVGSAGGAAGAGSVDAGTTAANSMTAEQLDGGSSGGVSSADASSRISPKPSLANAAGGYTGPKPLNFFQRLNPQLVAADRSAQYGLVQQQQADSASLQRGLAIQQAINDGAVKLSDLDATKAMDLAKYKAVAEQQLAANKSDADIKLANVNANNTGALNAGMPPSEYPKYAPKLAEGRAGVLDILNQNNQAQGNIDAYALSPKTNPDVLASAAMGTNQNYLAPAARNAIKLGIGDAAFMPSSASNMPLGISATGMVPPTTKTSSFQQIINGKPAFGTTTTDSSNPYGAAMGIPARGKIVIPSGNGATMVNNTDGDYDPDVTQYPPVSPAAITPKPDASPAAGNVGDSSLLNNLLYLLRNNTNTSPASVNSMGTPVSRLYNPYGN